MAAKDEATSKKVVLKKEYGSAKTTKPGLSRKAPAKRTPMLKVRGSTQVPEKPDPKEAPARRIATSKPKKVPTGETMKFTIESEDEAAGQDRKKKRVRTTTAKVLGNPSMRRDSEEGEEEVAAPAPKAQNLMGDAIKSGAASSKPKASPKPKNAPKRNTRSIPAAEKNKAPLPEVGDEEDDEAQVLRKLKPKIPDHNDAHPVAENMKLRKDVGFRQWRLSDRYAIRRRTAVDYRFHTKEQQDFYETVFLDKKPIVCDMRWVDWTYMKENEEHYPGVQDSFVACELQTLLGRSSQSGMMSYLCNFTQVLISIQMAG